MLRHPRRARGVFAALGAAGVAVSMAVTLLAPAGGAPAAFTTSSGVVGSATTAASYVPVSAGKHQVSHVQQATYAAKAKGERNEPRRGLSYQGLVKDRSCPGGWALQGDRSAAKCSPGPDDAPKGIDVTQVPSTQQLQGQAAEIQVAGTAAGSALSGNPGVVPCYGNGSDGKRVQAIYAVAEDKSDRFNTVAPLIAGYAANADRTYVKSAAETGGVRHIRWVTSPDCKLVVDHVVLSATGDDSFANTKSELRALGYTRTDRKYLVWTDAGVYCGISNVVGDDTPGLTNKNNVGPTFGRVDSACWGLTAPTEAHEIAHMLGAVQMSAPHSSGGWHCTDESDRMCYQDSSSVTLTYPCASSEEAILDCGKDDYFNTNPPVGSYLATHWNIANSEFLATADGAYPSATASPSPSPTPTSASPSPTTVSPSPTGASPKPTTASPSPTPTPTTASPLPTPTTGSPTPSPTTASPSPAPTAGSTTTVLGTWSGKLSAKRSGKVSFSAPSSGTLTVTLTDQTAKSDDMFFVYNSYGTVVGTAKGHPRAVWSAAISGASKFTVGISGPANYSVVVTLTTNSIVTASAAELAQWSGYVPAGGSKRVPFTVSKRGSVVLSFFDRTASSPRTVLLYDSNGVVRGTAYGAPIAIWSGTISSGSYTMAIAGEASGTAQVTLG